MKLFDRNKQPVEVPDDQVHEAIASGQYGAPAGTRIPVRWDGRVGSVPIENISEAIDGGAEVVPQSVYEKAELQAKYGDAAHAAQAFGTSALDTATLGASNALIRGIGGKSAAQSVRGAEEANPLASGAGTAAGIVAPVVADVFSGGAATPAVAGALERAGARGAEGAVSRAVAPAVERAVTRAPLEGVLEEAPRALRAAPEELVGEVVPNAPRALPPSGGVAPPAAPPPVRAPILEGEFEEIGRQATETPALARTLGLPPPAATSTPAARAVEAAASAERTEQAARAAEEAFDSGSKTAARETGKGVIRTVVEDALTGPTRLVQGAGQIVEDTVRDIVGREAETAIGRIAQKAVISGARGAFEGGTYGVTNEASHQFLQDDPELNGERLASAWVHGALLGGAFGGALGTLGQGSKEAIAKAVGREGVAQYLTDKAGEHMWRAAGPTKAMTAEAERWAGGASAVGNLIREDAQKILGRIPRSREELVELAEKMKELHGGEIDNIVKTLDSDENRNARVRLGEVLEDIDSQIKTLRKQASPTAELEAYRQRVLGAMPKGTVDPLTGEINRKAEITYDQLRSFRQEANERAKFGPYPGATTAPQDAFKKLGGQFEAKTEAFAEAVMGKAHGAEVSAYKLEKKQYQAALLLERAAARGVAAQGTNAIYSLTAKLAAIPGAMIGNAVAGPVGGFISHMATEHGAEFMKRNADFVISDVLARLANVAKGEHVLTAAQKTNERVQKRIDQGVKSFGRALKGQEVESVSVGGPKTFEERRDLLLSLAAQHEAVGEHIDSVTNPLDKAAPQVAVALKTASLRAIEYLLGELPKPPPPRPGSLTPQLDEKNWKADSRQAAQFNRKWDIVVHPELAPALVASGQYTVDHDVAINATHPKTKADAAAKMRAQLDKATKQPPVGIRGPTKLFLGEQPDREFLKLYQDSFKPSQPPKAPKAPKTKPLKMADNTTLNKTSS